MYIMQIQSTSRCGLQSRLNVLCKLYCYHFVVLFPNKFCDETLLCIHTAYSGTVCIHDYSKEPPS